MTAPGPEFYALVRSAAKLDLAQVEAMHGQLLATGRDLCAAVDKTGAPALDVLVMHRALLFSPLLHQLECDQDLLRALRDRRSTWTRWVPPAPPAFA